MGIAEELERHGKQLEQLEEHSKQLDEILELLRSIVGKVTYSDRRGSPTRIEGDVLVVLERRWGEVVPYDKIIELVWPTADPEWARKHGVSSAVARLRKKGFNVESVRGRGYRLI